MVSSHLTKVHVLHTSIHTRKRHYTVCSRVFNGDRSGSLGDACPIWREAIFLRFLFKQCKIWTADCMLPHHMSHYKVQSKAPNSFFGWDPPQTHLESLQHSPDLLRGLFLWQNWGTGADAKKRKDERSPFCNCKYDVDCLYEFPLSMSFSLLTTNKSSDYIRCRRAHATYSLAVVTMSAASPPATPSVASFVRISSIRNCTSSIFCMQHIARCKHRQNKNTKYCIYTRATHWLLGILQRGLKMAKN